MAYRISYGREQNQGGILRIQLAVSGCLLAAVMLGSLLCPAVKELFASGPSPAQAALAEGYAGGEGIRSSALRYCAAVLECAGYETEHLH